jgi:dTDP-4-dehydrorhamnose 3,5-epimerase
MKFTETPLPGAFIIDLEKKGDERGFFARYFCKKEYGVHNLCSDIVQINNSLSAQAGTLRGMHYQLPPKAEDKIVRCVKGALFDVIIDLRPKSSTFLQHFGVELTAENRRMLYVPKGFAHGFLSLQDNTETIYLVTEYYAADRERGIRYNDPEFGIQWPVQPSIVSPKDMAHPDFDPAWHLA